jgi:hypothetical protein
MQRVHGSGCRGGCYAAAPCSSPSVLCNNRAYHALHPGTQSRQSARPFGPDAGEDVMQQHHVLLLPGEPPPPLWERDPLACGRGGGRVPIRTRGQTPGYSRYISVLCAQVPRTMGNTGEPIPLPINHFESLSGPNLVSVRT